MRIVFSFKKCRLHPNVTDGIAKHRFHTNEAKPAPMVQAFALLQMMELFLKLAISRNIVTRRKSLSFIFFFFFTVIIIYLSVFINNVCMAKALWYMVYGSVFLPYARADVVILVYTLFVSLATLCL